MRKYNPNVRVGNWYNELMLEEEKAKQYMKKTRHSDLKVQKVRQLFLAMLKEVPLTFPVVGLSYGAVIQIVSPDVPCKTMFRIEEKQGIALAADIDFTHVYDRCTFENNDPVIGTGFLTPCVRNVWTLVPEDDSKKGKELRFGDCFYISLYASETPLYVEAFKQGPAVPKGESGHVLPRLVDKVSSLTRFKVVHVNPRLRYETEGTVVPPFERIVIMQAANSECLAVECDTWFPTYFGMECEVSVFTFKNNSEPNVVTCKNFWSFLLSSV